VGMQNFLKILLWSCKKKWSLCRKIQVLLF